MLSKVVFVVFYQMLAKLALNELNNNCGWILWALKLLNWNKKDFWWNKTHVKWVLGNRHSLVKSSFWSIISYQKSKKKILKIFHIVTKNHLKSHFHFFSKTFQAFSSYILSACSVKKNRKINNFWKTIFFLFKFSVLEYPTQFWTLCEGFSNYRKSLKKHVLCWILSKKRYKDPWSKWQISSVMKHIWGSPWLWILFFKVFSLSEKKKKLDTKKSIFKNDAFSYLKPQSHHSLPLRFCPSPLIPCAPPKALKAFNPPLRYWFWPPVAVFAAPATPPRAPKT